MCATCAVLCPGGNVGVASVLFRNLQSFLPSDLYVNMSTTVEPLIKDTLNKE